MLKILDTKLMSLQPLARRIETQKTPVASRLRRASTKRGHLDLNASQASDGPITTQNRQAALIVETAELPMTVLDAANLET